MSYRLPCSKFPLPSVGSDPFFLEIMIAVIPAMHNRTHTPIVIPIIVNFKSDRKIYLERIFLSSKTLELVEYPTISKYCIIPASSTVLPCPLDVLLSDIGGNLELVACGESATKCKDG